MIAATRPALATGRLSPSVGPPVMSHWSLIIAPPDSRGWRACYAVSAWATIAINDPWAGERAKCYELRAMEVVQALNNAYATLPKEA